MSVQVKPLQADVSQIVTDVTQLLADLGRKYPFMDFWSAPEDMITVDSSAADIPFPDIVVSGLPSGLTIRRVALILICRAIRDTSAAANYINAAGKTLRVMKSGGNWATQSIVGITFANGSLYCAASSKEPGLPIVGVDIKSIVDGNATYNVRSEQSNHGEGVVSLGDDLELYDVQVGLRVFYS